MAKQPNKVKRPWVVTRKPFERERTAEAFDYNCRRWRNLRKLFLENNPLCVECNSGGYVVAASVVDHKVRIEAGGEPWDESNLQGLCKKHHDSKSGREGASVRRGMG